MSKIKHPKEEFFHKIQKELKKDVKTPEIVAKYSSFGVTKYILKKFYVDNDNLSYIKRKEASRNNKKSVESDKKREKRKESERKEQKELFLTSIVKTMGNVSEACKQVGIHRREFYEWLSSEDEIFKTSYNDTVERSVDFVETKLMQEINDGNTTAIIFYLKTKGRDRGYIETQDLNLKGNINTAPAVIIIEGIDPDEKPE